MDGEGKCSELVANDVSRNDCCSVLGVAFQENEISNVSIFMVAAGIKKEACKPCRGWFKLKLKAVTTSACKPNYSVTHLMIFLFCTSS